MGYYQGAVIFIKIIAQPFEVVQARRRGTFSTPDRLEFCVLYYELLKAVFFKTL